MVSKYGAVGDEDQNVLSNDGILYGILPRQRRHS